MNIIMNEKEFALEAIESRSLGDSPSKVARTLRILAKYYHTQGYKKKQIVELLKEAVLRNDCNAVLSMWEGVIENVVKSTKDKILVEVDAVYVTKEELEICRQLESKQAQRVLFTAICLARYENAVRGDASGWVNVRYKDIFSMANVAVSKDRQCDIMYILVSAGLISLSGKATSTSFKVECLDDSGTHTLCVDDFRNLGNQYLMYCGEPYFKCSECGLVVRKKSNAQKYCKDCSAEVNRTKTRERQRTDN